jgi:hypothetical protein
MVDYKFEDLPDRKKPVTKTKRPTSKVEQEEVFSDGREFFYLSCGCGYRTTGHLNLVGCGKTMDYHVKTSHTA